MKNSTIRAQENILIVFCVINEDHTNINLDLSVKFEQVIVKSLVVQ